MFADAMVILPLHFQFYRQNISCLAMPHFMFVITIFQTAAFPFAEVEGIFAT